MAIWKLPLHRRFRLIFLFDAPIISEKHYHQILLTLAKEFPIIPQVPRSPAQPVYGNARDELNVFHFQRNILKLSDYPYVEPEEQQELPQETSTPTDHDTDGALEDFLQKHNIEYTPDQKSQHKFFVGCPFKEGHTDGICNLKDAFVTDRPQGQYKGKWGFHCSHASCKSKGNDTWEAFREGMKIPRKDSTHGRKAKRCWQKIER